MTREETSAFSRVDMVAQSTVSSVRFILFLVVEPVKSLGEHFRDSKEGETKYLGNEKNNG